MVTYQIEKNNNDICYWCGKPATSREHVPPRCFFPDKDKEDNSEITFCWDNLITVPSCNEHNNHKSGEDEYLLAHIAPIVNTNFYGRYKSIYKVRRSVERNRKLIKYVNDSLVECNNNRISLSLESIARALYYNKFSKPLLGSCYVYFPYFILNNGITITNRNAHVLAIIEKDSEKWNSEGNYPQIFSYKFSGIDDQGCACFLITFYESVKVCIILADNEHREQRSRLKQPELTREYGLRPEFFSIYDPSIKIPEE